MNFTTFEDGPTAIEGDVDLPGFFYHRGDLSHTVIGIMRGGREAIVSNHSSQKDANHFSGIFFFSLIHACHCRR